MTDKWRKLKTTKTKDGAELQFNMQLIAFDADTLAFLIVGIDVATIEDNPNFKRDLYVIMKEATIALKSKKQAQGEP